jgi:serine/threonine protein phosphatase PrpC
MSTIDMFGMSDTGLVRHNNEDRWLADPSLSVAVVADGMGGQACGEVAAQATLEAVRRYVTEPDLSLSLLQSAQEAVRAGNRRVRQMAREELACQGMGSTIIMAMWRMPQLVIANVGDSRAYLWRAGQLQQLSSDQTLQNELRQAGTFTEQQLKDFEYKNVLTMAIGAADDIRIQTAELLMQPGDEILLCSDGLWFIGDDVLSSLLADGLAADDTLESTVQHLIDTAKGKGGHDNITAVLLRYRDPERL